MTEPTSCDMQTTNLVNNEIADALSIIAKKWGVRFTDVVNTFNDITLTSISKVRFLDANSVDQENKRRFKRCCFLFGLEPHHYGTMVWIGKTTWELVGIDANSPKQPFLIKNVRTGKLRRYSVVGTGSIRSAYDIANSRKLPLIPNLPSEVDSSAN